MNNQITEEMVNKAVAWWVNEIAHGGKLDNGDTSQSGGMAMMLGLLLQSRNLPTQTQLNQFKTELKKLILEHNPYTIGCDYGPDWLLGEAASKANIDSSVFPWKTVMWLQDGTVSVACGYCASPVEL